MATESGSFIETVEGHGADQAGATPQGLGTGTGADSVRTVINAAIRDFARQAEDAGIRYGFGIKNIGSGRIDCSGFVSTAMTHVSRALSQGIKTGDGQTVAFPDHLAFARSFMTNSEGQIARLQANGATVLGPSLSKADITGGMVLAADNGRTRFDAGRLRGIDHVLVTFEDEKGRVMVAESASSQGGVKIRTLDEWYASNGRKNLFAANVTDVLALDADPENDGEIQLAFANQAGHGRQIPGSGKDPDLFYALVLGQMSGDDIMDKVAGMTDDELHQSSIWHSTSQSVYNLQTGELKDYYPQADTAGLGAHAARIAGDGLLGEITTHGIRLAKDADGSFASEHIATALRTGYFDEKSLLKLDASLNRVAKLEGADTEVVPVDGRFDEHDASRVLDFIEDHRGDSTFQLGDSAVAMLIGKGKVSVDDLAKATGMDPSDIEAANKRMTELVASVGTDATTLERREIVVGVLGKGADAFNIPKPFAVAVWGAESTFSTVDLQGQIISPTGVRGDFQVTRDTFRDAIRQHGSSIASVLKQVGFENEATTIGRMASGTHFNNAQLDIIRSNPAISATVGMAVLRMKADSLGIGDIAASQYGQVYERYNGEGRGLSWYNSYIANNLHQGTSMGLVEQVERGPQKPEPVALEQSTEKPAAEQVAAVNGGSAKMASAKAGFVVSEIIVDPKDATFQTAAVDGKVSPKVIQPAFQSESAPAEETVAEATPEPAKPTTPAPNSPTFA